MNYLMLCIFLLSPFAHALREGNEPRARDNHDRRSRENGDGLERRREYALVVTDENGSCAQQIHDSYPKAYVCQRFLDRTPKTQVVILVHEAAHVAGERN